MNIYSKAIKMYQLFAGLFAEGTTDIRFLENIVQTTLEKVAYECQGLIEVISRINQKA